MQESGCESVIIEEDFDDSEFSAEHREFYSKLYLEPSKLTTRLHFFKTVVKDITGEELTKALTANSYLGYVTLRPLAQRTICDCMISKAVFSSREGTFSPHHYLLCNTEQEIDIHGVKFPLVGTKGLQQDARIGACAQVALKVLNDNMPPGFTQKPIFTPDITAIANEIPTTGRSVPTSGLNVFQLVHVLRHMGYQPIAYADQGPDDLEKIIYRYIESGFPVILGIKTKTDAHALVVVGHTFSSNMWYPLVQDDYYGDESDSSSGYLNSVRWVDDFIIMDDNTGPYVQMPKEMIKNIAYCLIIPLPKEVFLFAEEAELAANVAVKTLLGTLPSSHSTDLNASSPSQYYWFEKFMSNLVKNKMILRTLLITREKFLEGIADTTGLSAIVKTIYNNLKLPDLFWLTELSYPDIFCQQRLRFGEVIVDPTADAKQERSALVVHIPSSIWALDTATLEYTGYYPITDDFPYKHVNRLSED